MAGFIIRRLLWAIPVLFFVSLVSFFLMHQAPGGPFDKDNNKKQVDGATLKALNARFGLDKPQYFNPSAASKLWNDGERNPLKITRAYLDSQFFNYIFNATRGDLGPSYRQRGKSVQDIILKQWPYSMRLGLFALIFAVMVGIPLGVTAALKQNSIVDYVSLFFATIGVSVPTFVTGLLVIILATMSFITRITRTTVLEVKRQDYIRTARAKGLGERMVISRHILRNALIPVVTVLGPALVDLIAGAVITESIFSIPGIGKFFVDSIFQRDYSMIMGSTLLYATLVVLANILVDLSYGFLDPRIRNIG